MMRKLLSLCLLLALLLPVCVSAKEYKWHEGGDKPTDVDYFINREKVREYLNTLKEATDSRQVFHSSSPEFLESYGKLYIGDSQACTGNLVSNKPANDSYIVTSSAHCFKTDTPEGVSIVFLKRNGDEIKRQLTLENINHERDYAILRLDRKIENSSIKPLVISPFHSEDLIYEAEIFVDSVRLTMAGFSSDVHLGQNGKVLTYDQSCEAFGERERFLVDTDCTAYPGASGGAAVFSLDESEFHIDYFVGVNKSVSGDIRALAYDKPEEVSSAAKVQRAYFVDVTVMHDDLFKALGCTEDDLYDYEEVIGIGY